MRTVQEIQADIAVAHRTQDVDTLLRAADELAELGTPGARAAGHSARGMVALLHGRHADALSEFHQARAVHEELGNWTDAAGALENEAITHAIAGEFSTALECFHRALAIQEEHGSRSSVAQIIGHIGNVYSSTGDYPSALEQFHRALALHEELGDRLATANVLGSLGILQRQLGEYEEALEYYRRALPLFEQHGHHPRVAATISNIGNVYLTSGRYAEAVEQFRRSIDMYQEFGSNLGATNTSVSLLSAYVALGSIDEAQELLTSLDDISMDEAEWWIARESGRASLQILLNEHEAATSTLQNILAKAEAHGLRSQVADAHRRLRDAAQARNDFAGYIEHNNEYTRIREEINGKATASRLATQEADRRIAKERAERERERAILYSALPGHVADRLVRGEDVSGDDHDRTAVLFLDIAGFTTHSGNLDPQQTTKLLDQIFHHFDDISARHNVTKIKTIGDSYMAVAFGSEEGVSAEGLESVRRAASAALEMIASEFYWPTATADGNSNRVQFRIGLHSGPVVAGVIGKQRLQYDVWGDTVNVASRMESTGEPGRIQVSSQFATALGNGESGMGNASEARVIPSASEEPYSPFPITYSLRERGTIEIKGKGPMTTYWLEEA